MCAELGRGGLLFSQLGPGRRPYTVFLTSNTSHDGVLVRAFVAWPTDGVSVALYPPAYPTEVSAARHNAVIPVGKLLIPANSRVIIKP